MLKISAFASSLVIGSTWTLRTVEWSHMLTAAVQEQIHVTHYVLPDLPHVYSEKDRRVFHKSIPTHQQIITLAVSRHRSATSLLQLVQYLPPQIKILLVGGNDKHTCAALSTLQAARIIRENTNVELWGVANPNDPASVSTVHAKMQAGITGFITQPLLSSQAWETLESYPTNATLIAGLAVPKNAKSLQFWQKLIDSEQEPPQLFSLDKDPLFQSHLAYFHRPNASSLDWVQNELGKLARSNHVHGIHFMPLKNVQDLVSLPWN